MKRAHKKVLEAKDKGMSALPAEVVEKMDCMYRRLVQQGYSNLPPDPPQRGKGRQKHSDMYNLVRRLDIRQKEVCRFYHDFRVPFTNNQAERDLRVTKTKSKVIGTFRCEDGMAGYMNATSFISTGLKNGHSIMESIMGAITGSPGIVLS